MEMSDTDWEGGEEQIIYYFEKQWSEGPIRYIYIHLMIFIPHYILLYIIYMGGGDCKKKVCEFELSICN